EVVGPLEASPARPPVPRVPARRTSVPAGEAELAGGSREVVVRIMGAMGGTLRIDGAPMQWFGDVRHTLALGPHRFEFVSPDGTCCQSSERTVSVVAGEGPQQVIGEIPFLDATLRVSAAESDAGFITCPTLFSGDQPFPGERRIAMSRATATGICTLRPQSAAAAAGPQKTEVTLRAGQTQVIPWP
ncbi:MAG: hypothetical protein RL033_708, partial [Pseudomonadota bacterium]